MKSDITPFELYKNIYFVGSSRVSVHIIKTEVGLVMIDTGYPDMYEQIIFSMQEVGLDPKNICAIFHTHGHIDHFGCTTELKKLSGATTYISAIDNEIVNGNRNLSWADELGLPIAPYFECDVLINDGDMFDFGDVKIRAKLTPGHTEGVLTYFIEMPDKTVAAMHGGVGLNSLSKDFLIKKGLSLTLRDEFLKGLETLKSERVDLVLGNHPGQNSTIKKLEATQQGKSILDKNEWQKFLNICKEKLIYMLNEEKGDYLSDKTVNEDTMKITEFKMVGEFPDLLTFANGKRVKTKEDWQNKKDEMFKDVIDLQFGTQPPAPEFLEIEPTYLGGNPSTYIIKTGKKDAPVCFTMTVFKAARGKAPVVITGDACFKYMYDKEYISTFLKAGIHFACFNRTELAPDIAEYNINSLPEGSEERNLAQKIYNETIALGNCGGRLKNAYPEYSFGAIGAWAWGYSRCVDALEKLGIADMSCITFTGHSRGGKTCALAGALDERAAIVNPNASCCGGYGSYRVKIKAELPDGSVKESEPLSNQFYHFPAWLGEGMKKYIDNEAEIPFDSHHLKAMVAPRTLFVSESADDIMANPVGSYITTEEAGKVFELLDAKENLIWYFRRGPHYQAIEDISQLVNVIRHKKFGEPLNDKFFKLPFKRHEL